MEFAKMNEQKVHNWLLNQNDIYAKPFTQSERTTRFNLRLGGARNVASAIISHEETQ